MNQDIWKKGYDRVNKWMNKHQDLLNFKPNWKPLRMTLGIPIMFVFGMIHHLMYEREHLKWFLSMKARWMFSAWIKALFTVLTVLGIVGGLIALLILGMMENKKKAEEYKATHWSGQEIHIPADMQLDMPLEEVEYRKINLGKAGSTVSATRTSGILTRKRDPDHQPQIYKILDTNGVVKGTIIEDE